MADVRTAHFEMPGFGGELVEPYGPEKFAKLQALKSKWDPTNLFCHN
jgi:hypothetical protein